MVLMYASTCIKRQPKEVFSVLKEKDFLKLLQKLQFR